MGLRNRSQLDALLNQSDNLWEQWLSEFTKFRLNEHLPKSSKLESRSHFSHPSPEGMKIATVSQKLEVSMNVQPPLEVIG